MAKVRKVVKFQTKMRAQSACACLTIVQPEDRRVDFGGKKTFFPFFSRILIWFWWGANGALLLIWLSVFLSPLINPVVPEFFFIWETSSVRVHLHLFARFTSVNFFFFSKAPENFHGWDDLILQLETFFCFWKVVTFFCILNEGKYYKSGAIYFEYPLSTIWDSIDLRYPVLGKKGKNRKKFSQRSPRPS